MVDPILTQACGATYEVTPAAGGIFSLDELRFFVETHQPLAFPAADDSGLFVICGAQPSEVAINLKAAALASKPIRGWALICPSRFLPIPYVQ